MKPTPRKIHRTSDVTARASQASRNAACLSCLHEHAYFCVEGGSSVVAVSSSSVNTGILQHALGGISAVGGSCRAAQNSRNAESVDDALLWRQNRITQSNHTAGARTKANPAPVLFANQLQVKFDQRNAVILVASDWRDKLNARILRLLAKDAKVAMMAAVSGSLHLVVTHAEKLHIILWGMQYGSYSDAMHALHIIGPEDSELWPLLALVCALRISDLMTRDLLISQCPIFKAICCTKE